MNILLILVIWYALYFLSTIPIILLRIFIVNCVLQILITVFQLSIFMTCVITIILPILLLHNTGEQIINYIMRFYRYIKCIVYSPPYRIKENNEKTEMCCICLDGIICGDRIYTSKCNHEYHYDCIYDWVIVSGTCPYCRQLL